MAANIFATGMGAFDDAYDRTQRFREDRARIGAGRALASGNRTGAMQELGGAGMVDGVRALERDAQVGEQQQYDREREAKADERAEAERRVRIFRAAAPQLKRIPQGQRKQALQHPIWAAAGITPDIVANLGEEDITDANIDMVLGEVEKAYQQLYHNPEHGIFGVRQDGRVDALHKFPRKPLVVPQTSDIFVPQDGPEPVDLNVSMDGDVARDTLSGGQGADSLAGGDGGRSIPGYRMVRQGRPPKGAEPPGRWVDMPEAESGKYGAGRYMRNTKTGEVKPISGAGKEPTEGSKKTAMFSYRAIKANERMNALAAEGITQPTAWQLVTDKNGIRRFALDKMQPNDRRFLSASKEWLAPILRRDTGAAVTDDEFLFYADIFIPQPGDPPQLLKQKAEARKDAMDAMVFEEKDLLNKTYGPQKYNVRFAPDRKAAAGRTAPKTQGNGWRIIP